jgi:very-short-patch-repair endonuclease
VVRGIPVTTAGRTLDDLRRVFPRVEFAAALREAEFLRLPVDAGLATDRTRSELEARLLGVCRSHRLPQPKVNVPVGPFVVDFLWQGARLIVELDGWESHRTRSAFEGDRARDVRLKLLGYDVLRFTWKSVTEDPSGVATAIRSLLDR